MLHGRIGLDLVGLEVPEALVERLAAADVVVCLLEHVVAGNQKRHEEQHKAGVDVARGAECGGKGAELIEGVHHGKNAQRYQDAAALMLKGLFLLALLLWPISPAPSVACGWDSIR